MSITSYKGKIIGTNACNSFLESNFTQPKIQAYHHGPYNGRNKKPKAFTCITEYYG